MILHGVTKEKHCVMPNASSEHVCLFDVKKSFNIPEYLINCTSVVQVHCCMQSGLVGV